MLALVEEGAISPGAEDVAHRAAVGLRSVFRHFKDMDSLYAEMAVRLSRVYEAALQPFQADGWRGQLSEAIERRIDIFERLLPFKRAADAHRHESPVLAANHAASLALMRARLKPLLPERLQEDPIALETLDMLLSVDTWVRLRVEQKLDAGHGAQGHRTGCGPPRRLNRQMAFAGRFFRFGLAPRALCCCAAP